MVETHTLILQSAQALVTDLFRNKVNENVRFHTIDHTREVVEACQRMAEHYQLPEDDRFALLLAAWFHDTGYSSGQARDHETVSLKLATDFLTAHSIHGDLTGKVIGCINATRLPQNAATTIEGSFVMLTCSTLARMLLKKSPACCGKN